MRFSNFLSLVLGLKPFDLNLGGPQSVNLSSEMIYEPLYVGGFHAMDRGISIVHKIVIPKVL